MSNKQVQFRYDTAANLAAATPAEGEPGWASDTKEFVVGDGSTAGGIPMVKKAGGQNLTGGYTATTYDAGTKSSGTFTPDPELGNAQKFVNDGAFTLAPPSPIAPADFTSMIIDQTNGSSAGTITRSGFDKVTGDDLTTTEDDKFRHYISVGPTGSHIHTQAMQ
jgi:hypothetical protein